MTYTPWLGRRFGVEMEMNQVTTTNVSLEPRPIGEAIRRGLSAAGLPMSRLNRQGPSWHRSDGTTWDLKTDSSCGWEIASPAMEMDVGAECAELRAVCEQITAMNPKVDRRCGLHVHVDVSDFDWEDLKALVCLWARYEPYWFELCPPSRRRNTYCPPYRKSEWAAQNSGVWTRIEQLFTARDRAALEAQTGVTPRGSLNLGHFWRSHRVEFRLGAGTVEYEKVVRWAQLMLAIVGRAKHSRPGMTPCFPPVRPGGWSDRPIGTEFVARTLGLRPTIVVPEPHPAAARLVEWMEARRVRFSGVTAEQGDAIEQAVARGEAAAPAPRAAPRTAAERYGANPFGGVVISEAPPARPLAARPFTPGTRVTVHSGEGHERFAGHIATVDRVDDRRREVTVSITRPDGTSLVGTYPFDCVTRFRR